MPCYEFRCERCKKVFERILFHYDVEEVECSCSGRAKRTETPQLVVRRDPNAGIQQ